MLKVEIQSAPPVVTIHCSGRLVLGVEAETLRCVVTSRPERNVALDLSQVYWIDAAGLGLLVELQHWALGRSVRLTITNPSVAVYKLIVMTGLDRVLHIVGEPVGCGIRENTGGWQTMTA